MRKGQQKVMDQQQVDSSKTGHVTSCFTIFAIGCMYFVQGCAFSIALTVKYVYSELPDYLTLSLFSLSLLPFSFKFLTAPILEKYSIISYGKRKTWIVGSQLLTIVTILACSFFTQFEQAHTFALLIIIMYLSLSFQDIALDALCLKQLKCSKAMSVIQGSCQPAGTIVGSIVLLKFTCLQFAQNFGFSKPIANLHQLLIGFCLVMLSLTVLIHFKLKQTYLKSEQETAKESIIEVYSLYRFFFNRQYKYCRVFIYVVLFYQGFNLFLAGYEYELIKSGFQKNTINTVNNVQNIIITILTFAIGSKASQLGYKKTFILTLGLTWIILLYVFFDFPKSLTSLILTNFFYNFFFQWILLARTALTGDFPENGVTGMLYTMSASGGNLGRNVFIHTALLKYFQWKKLAIVGLIIQLVLIVAFVPRMMKLIGQGKTQIQLNGLKFYKNKIDYRKKHHHKRL